jgi:hypothetical protein
VARAAQVHAIAEVEVQLRAAAHDGREVIHARRVGPQRFRDGLGRCEVTLHAVEPWVEPRRKLRVEQRDARIRIALRERVCEARAEEPAAAGDEDGHGSRIANREK